MSLFPLTPDKLGPLICKRINRLTLFARARWHMEPQEQKQGTRTWQPCTLSGQDHPAPCVEQCSLYKSVDATSVIRTLTKQERLLTI